MDGGMRMQWSDSALVRHLVWVVLVKLVLDQIEGFLPGQRG